MNLVLEIIFLLIGFICLIKGADYFVDGSSEVAKKLRIPSIVVGLTIVAIGTSLPELAVSVFASVKNSNDIAFSNVIGSNIFNLLMVLGVAALFANINVKKSILKREFPFLMFTTLVVLFLAGDILWFGNVFGKVNLLRFEYGTEQIGTVGRADGVLLLLLFVGFIFWTVSYALQERKKTAESDLIEETFSNAKCIFYIVGGAVAIILGGQIVVDCAKGIALTAGMSETLVGLTVVALGTSLPELVTSAVAAKKGEADLAIGNVIGSNISNILLVLGMSATISPVSVPVMSMIDTLISFVAVVFVFIISFTKKSIRRGEGAFIILFYAVYLGYIVCRQL